MLSPSAGAGSGLSPILRQVGSSVITYAASARAQREAGIGSFSGDKVICAEPSTGERVAGETFCYVLYV